MRQGIVVTGLLGVFVAIAMFFMGGQSLFTMPAPATAAITVTAPSAAAADTLGLLRWLSAGVARLDLGKRSPGQDGFAALAQRAVAATEHYVPFIAPSAPPAPDSGATMTAVVEQPSPAAAQPAAIIRVSASATEPPAIDPAAARRIAEAAEFDRLTVAAAAGDSDAKYRLGILYRDGMGVARDPAAAAKWLLASAKDGNALAARALGEMYETGIGVARDAAAAYAWLDRAAAHSPDIINRDLAARERDHVGAAMSPGELTAARKLRLSDQSPATSNQASGLTAIAG